MSTQAINQEIDNIKNQLVAKYQPQRIILFGSATQSDKVINDLDFLIIKNGLTDSYLDRMRQVRHLLDKNMAADFIVLTPSELESRQFKRDPMILNIIDTGRVLYG